MERESKYIKIANWYYNLGLTQDEIAKRLFVSRQRVNQMIRSLAKRYSHHYSQWFCKRKCKE